MLAASIESTLRHRLLNILVASISAAKKSRVSKLRKDGVHAVVRRPLPHLTVLLT